MLWIKSGIENPSKSEVIGRCGGDEKTEWPRRTDKKSNAKKIKIKTVFIILLYYDSPLWWSSPDLPSYQVSKQPLLGTTTNVEPTLYCKRVKTGLTSGNFMFLSFKYIPILFSCNFNIKETITRQWKRAWFDSNIITPFITWYSLFSMEYTYSHFVYLYTTYV